MGAEPAVYFVILNWKGWRDTLECLESLKILTYGNYSIVVVDNDSQDNSIEEIRRWIVQNGVPCKRYTLSSGERTPQLHADAAPAESGLRCLHLVEAHINKGFCAGNNIGLALAWQGDADYSLILNNDTVCEPGLLEPLVRTAENDDSVGLLGSLICYYEERESIWWAGGNFSSMLSPTYSAQGQDRSNVEGREPYDCGWVSGCATFIPMRLYEKVGGFDERFFIWCEEWDLSLRFRKAGYRLLIVPSAVLYHKVGKSLGVLSPLTFFYSMRNMIMLRRRHLDFSRRAVYSFAYIPYKFVQSILYSVKLRDRRYFLGFIDALSSGLTGKGGIWKRQ